MKNTPDPIPLLGNGLRTDPAPQTCFQKLLHNGQELEGTQLPIRENGRPNVGTQVTEHDPHTTDGSVAGRGPWKTARGAFPG